LKKAQVLARHVKIRGFNGWARIAFKKLERPANFEGFAVQTC
jgi:hypothetical protein